MRARTYIPRGTQRQVCELRRQVPGCGTGAQVCEFGPAPACGGGPCCVNTAHSWAHAGRHVCAPSQVWAHVPDLAPTPAITRRCTGSLTGGQTRPPHPCARTSMPADAPTRALAPRRDPGGEQFPRLAASPSPVGTCFIAAGEEQPSASSDASQLAGRAPSGARPGLGNAGQWAGGEKNAFAP